jgi:hypothetical protein
MKNLAPDEKYAIDLAKFKTALNKWEDETEVMKPVLVKGGKAVEE